MDIDSQEQSAERGELHFLAATIEELMKALVAKDILSREDMQAIEEAVSARMGTVPRIW